MTQGLSVVTAIGSLVLVAVTIWYAWQTQQMVHEMRDARVASLRPSIRLDLGDFTGAASIDVENVGVGPATDISVELVVSNDEGVLEKQNWTSPLLRSGDSRTMLMPNKGGIFGNAAPVSYWADLGARVHMTGDCLDLDGRAHRIDDVLDFSVHSSRGPEGTWVGVSERVPKNIEKIAAALEDIQRTLDRS